MSSIVVHKIPSYQSNTSKSIGYDKKLKKKKERLLVSFDVTELK